MIRFKFPYPFFQDYEFTLIKRDKNKKNGEGVVGFKREIVGGWVAGG